MGDIREEFMASVPRKSARVLIPGCGNAPLLFEMYDEGYTDIVCGDNSPVVIQQMSADSDRNIQWDVMDATCMPYPDGSFDVVVDKALIDCLECSDNAIENIRRYIDEV